jgi:hypothetical protein
MTDSLDTVHIFDSLAAGPGYNDLLKAGVDLLIEFGVDLRVIHIAGKENEVADALSRHDFDRAINLVPKLEILVFQPPQCVLGAAKK